MYESEIIQIAPPLRVVRIQKRTKDACWHARANYGGESRSITLGTKSIQEARARASCAIYEKFGMVPVEKSEVSIPEMKKMLGRCAKRSARKGFEFNLTLEIVLDILDKQGNRCAITGLCFRDAKGSSYRNPLGPSIDRIDSSKGYFVNNVRVVCTVANWALSDWGDSIFDLMCRSYVSHAAAPAPDAL